MHISWRPEGRRAESLQLHEALLSVLLSVQKSAVVQSEHGDFLGNSARLRKALLEETALRESA